MRHAEKLGKREINKEDKLRRIKAAARALFVSSGYDEASTREIAVKAEVALGTLFLYASNKRDLLFLVVNDELEDVAAKAIAEIRPGVTLIENLLAAFRPLYAFFGKEPRLSRLTLREMMFYETGEQAKRFIKTRERMVGLCIELVDMAKGRKEVRSSANSQTAGEVLYAIFQIEIRRWLTLPRHNLASGISRLKAALQIAISGLSNTDIGPSLRT
jgi:AcrR family transcriptional regulator